MIILPPFCHACLPSLHGCFLCGSFILPALICSFLVFPDSACVKIFELRMQAPKDKTAFSTTYACYAGKNSPIVKEVVDESPNAPELAPEG